MSIKKFRAGRVSTVTAETWVGEHGTIFYDENTGILRLADGVTPGGHAIAFYNQPLNTTDNVQFANLTVSNEIVGNVSAQTITVANITSLNGTVNIYGNNNVYGQTTRYGNANTLGDAAFAGNVRISGTLI